MDSAKVKVLLGIAAVRVLWVALRLLGVTAGAVATMYFIGQYMSGGSPLWLLPFGVGVGICALLLFRDNLLIASCFSMVGEIVILIERLALLPAPEWHIYIAHLYLAIVGPASFYLLVILLRKPGPYEGELRDVHSAHEVLR